MSRLARFVAAGFERRPEQSLLIVTDGAGWILDEVGAHLLASLPPSFDARLVSDGWARARDCTVHFIDRRWAWADGVLDGVHESNRLIGVWWHGRLDSPDPGMQAALGRLGALRDRFVRFHVTCSSARHTLEAVGVAPQRIKTLPLGIDLRLFQPPAGDADRRGAREALGIDDKTIAIGCFQKDGSGWQDDGKPKLIKGPDILVDALARLSARFPVHAVIPGPARGYVKTALRRAQIPFSAPGMVSRQELPRLYHALDLYLSPSRDEGGPAGVLESMATGVPVVSSKTGMPADLIEPGVNGQLVEIGDPGALAAAAAELIERPALRAALSERGLVSIQPYDWRVLAGRYAAELYLFPETAASG